MFVTGKTLVIIIIHINYTQNKCSYDNQHSLRKRLAKKHHTTKVTYSYNIASNPMFFTFLNFLLIFPLLLFRIPV